MKLFAIIAASFLLTGCENTHKALFRPLVTTLPGQTNIVVSTGTNGMFLTNVLITSSITTTQWVKREDVFGTVDAVGSMVPGYGTIAVAGIGLAASLYLSWLNRKKQGKSDTYKDVAIATFESLEQFRNGLKASGETGRKIDDKLKSLLQNAHLDAGVMDMVVELLRQSKSHTAANVITVNEIPAVLGVKPIREIPPLTAPGPLV